MVRGLQLATEDDDPGIDVIVYVISASDRFTKDQRTAIEVIKGSDFWSYVLVVFTHADGVRGHDKRRYILNLLEGEKCPQALKLMMDKVNRRFMILNTLETSEAYRKEHLYTLLCNLHSMKEKNKSRRYSHQLFVDIHDKYKGLKAQAREHSETVSMLLQRTNEMRESYMQEIETLEAKTERLELEVKDAMKLGKNVEELQYRIAAFEEEKSRKKNEVEEEVRCLKMELEQCKASYNEEATRKQALEQNVERLKEELRKRRCDRRHCPLL